MENINSGADTDNRQQSVQSKESEVDLNLSDDSENEDDLDDDYAFMTLTQEEQSQWEAMIQKLKSELQERGKEFADWTDRITRRRMYAYSRIKKLEKCHQQRLKFYNNVHEFLDTFEEDVTKVKMQRISNVKNDTGMQAGHVNRSDLDSNIVKTVETPGVTQQPPSVTT